MVQLFTRRTFSILVSAQLSRAKQLYQKLYYFVGHRGLVGLLIIKFTMVSRNLGSNPRGGRIFIQENSQYYHRQKIAIVKNVKLKLGLINFLKPGSIDSKPSPIDSSLEEMESLEERRWKV